MWKEKLWRRKLKNALQNNIIYYQILGHRIFCFLLNTNKEMKKKNYCCQLRPFWSYMSICYLLRSSSTCVLNFLRPEEGHVFTLIAIMSWKCQVCITLVGIQRFISFVRYFSIDIYIYRTGIRFDRV